MKKNLSSFHKSAIDQPITTSELFSSKQSKQRVLQQLKRGTLFRWSRKKEADFDHTFNNHIFDEPKSWLYDIKLGIENQADESQGKQSEDEQKKAVNKLPTISKFIASPYRNGKHTIEKRCDKITCLTKKLSKMGAWKDQNSKNLTKNISRLQKSLNLDQCSLTQDDFCKVQGFNAIHDRSLQSSLIFLDKSSILQNNSGFNPFLKFPNFSETLSAGFKQKRKKKQNRRNKQIIQQQQNSSIPKFLMNSIILHSPKGNGIK